jgi:hypothetical protein
MKSFARIAAVATVAFMSATSNVAAQALPSAAEIVAKHIAAIGGKDAIAKITSMTQTGTMDIPTAGLSATMESMVASPNKVIIKNSIANVGDIQQGFDGTTGWSTNPMQGPRLLTGKELEQMKEQADFQTTMLYPADRFSTMETVGMVDFNGEKAYKVRFVRKGSGRESTEYFSVASGLQIGQEMTQESEMGKMPLTMTVSEYKQFGPLKVPTKTETTMGANKMVMTIKDVTFNTAPATAFELPAQVKALIKP